MSSRQANTPCRRLSTQSRQRDIPLPNKTLQLAHRAAYLHRTPFAPSGDASRGREPSR
jgi:hypothetical protein